MVRGKERAKVTDAERQPEDVTRPLDRGASKEFLDRPDIRAQIEWAKSLIGTSAGRRGKTADELFEAAREQARMEPEA